MLNWMSAAKRPSSLLSDNADNTAGVEAGSVGVEAGTVVVEADAVVVAADTDVVADVEVVAAAVEADDPAVVVARSRGPFDERQFEWRRRFELL